MKKRPIPFNDAKRAGNLPPKHWGDTTMNDLRTAAQQALAQIDEALRGL